MGKFDAKKHALAFATVALMVATACEGKHESAEERAEREEAYKERAADSIRRAQDREIARFYDHVYDSVAQKNGHKAYGEEIDSERRVWKDENQIDSIEYEHSLAGTMEQELAQMGKPVVQNAEQKLSDLFHKYGLQYEKLFTEEDIASDHGYFHTELFTGIDYEDDYEEKLWQDHVYSIIKSSDFGDIRKQEIRQKARAIIVEAEKALVANRRKVEAQNKDYFSAGESYIVDKPDVSYAGEGEVYGGYGDLNVAARSKALVVGRKISVYDQNLDMDFFGEPGAKYKLVSVGKGKWQVVKTKQNGRVEKTKVFSDNKDFDIFEYSVFDDEEYDEQGTVNSIPKVGDSEFWFEPGANLGVRVGYSEVIKVEKRKKEWKPTYTPKEQRVLDSLHRTVARKKQVSTQYWETGQQAKKVADSMTMARYGRGKPRN